MGNSSSAQEVAELGGTTMDSCNVEEDFISCALCMERYDDESRKPKYIDCHHSFCKTCIQDLFNDAEWNKKPMIKCPTCRRMTQRRRNIDDLTTNVMALKLLSVANSVGDQSGRNVEERAKKPPSQPANPLDRASWCRTCSAPSSAACWRRHDVTDGGQACAERMAAVKALAQQCVAQWNQAADGCLSAAQSLTPVRDSLRLLMVEVARRMDADKERETQLRAAVRDVDDLPSLPQLKPMDEMDELQLVRTMCDLDERSERLRALDKKVSSHRATVDRLLDQFKSLEKRQVSLDGRPIRLSLAGGCADNPTLKVCTSVLSFLVLLMSEDEAAQPAPAAVVKKPAVPPAAPASPSKKKPQAGAPPPSSSSTSSSLSNAAKKVGVGRPLTAQDKVVSLQLTVDGQDAGCFVVRLDVETAPTMCTKFLGLCRLEPGYRNTSVFKTQPNFSLMAGWVDAEWRHQFFYTADRSTLLERRGSVRMHINRVIDGNAEVGTEFLVMLADRKPTDQRKYSTVFGHVIQGLELCDRVSRLDVTKVAVVIARCSAP